MYAREQVARDAKWEDRLVNFFQYLTQAAAKVDSCCVVASLLASDPLKTDAFGRRLLGSLYDVFQRQREEAVEPVVKEDVAELLRRRFFTPKSIANRDAFRPHVQAALKGIFDIDDQTQRQGLDAEDRYLKSYPFHPDLTEVFYTKWTQLDRFQKARGVLRTFALALREAVNWDTAPLVGPGVLLNAPNRDGLSEALRELVTVADTEEHEGKERAWAGILEHELGRAREIQLESVGLGLREIERAVVGTFLHSQPIGQSARSRDLIVALAMTRPDRIELEKGLARWAQASFWLDDQYTAVGDGQLPSTWRLGNRPNLTQMHSVAAGRVTDDVARARLVDEIGKVKSLTTGASAAGVRVHTLPTRPRDIEDDSQFHYAVMAPSAASDSGKPSPEAKRFLDETTGPEKPRVYRNAVLLLAPTKNGLEVALARIRDYLAWEQVRSDLNDQGRVEVARKYGFEMQVLDITIDETQNLLRRKAKAIQAIPLFSAQDRNSIEHGCFRRRLSGTDLLIYESKIERLLQQQGIKVISGPPVRRIARTIQESDIYKKLAQRQFNVDGARHDAIAMEYVKNIRGSEESEFRDVEAFFVTDSHGFLDNRINADTRLPYVIRAEELLNIMWLLNPIATSTISRMNVSRVFSTFLDRRIPGKEMLLRLDAKMAAVDGLPIDAQDCRDIVINLSLIDATRLEELLEIQDENEMRARIADLAIQAREKSELERVEANRKIEKAVGMMKQSYEDRIAEIEAESDYSVQQLGQEKANLQYRITELQTQLADEVSTISDMASVRSIRERHVLLTTLQQRDEEELADLYEERNTIDRRIEKRKDILVYSVITVAIAAGIVLLTRLILPHWDVLEPVLYVVSIVLGIVVAGLGVLNKSIKPKVVFQRTAELLSRRAVRRRLAMAQRIALLEDRVQKTKSDLSGLVL